MGNLNEEVATIVRRKWDRSNRVVVDNTYGKMPTITFEVQTATTENEVLTGTTPKAIITVELNPDEVYPLLNPLDDSVLDPNGGSHTMLQIHLYSLFRYKAGY